MTDTGCMPWRVEKNVHYVGLWDVYDCDGNIVVEGKVEEVARLIVVAPKTAAERDRFRAVNAELVNALELAAKYLGKAVAEGLMSECVRSPCYALVVANRALNNAWVDWPRREAALAELVEKRNEVTRQR